MELMALGEIGSGPVSITIMMQGVAKIQEGAPRTSSAVVCSCGSFTAQVSWPVDFDILRFR